MSRTPEPTHRWTSLPAARFKRREHFAGAWAHHRLELASTLQEPDERSECGQRAVALMSGSARKLVTSVSMPTEKRLPVSGQTSMIALISHPTLDRMTDDLAAGLLKDQESGRAVRYGSPVSLSMLRRQILDPLPSRLSSCPANSRKHGGTGVVEDGFIVGSELIRQMLSPMIVHLVSHAD
jgi:hypothetical protein